MPAIYSPSDRVVPIISQELQLLANKHLLRLFSVGLGSTAQSKSHPRNIVCVQFVSAFLLFDFSFSVFLVKYKYTFSSDYSYACNKGVMTSEPKKKSNLINPA